MRLMAASVPLYCCAGRRLPRTAGSPRAPATGAITGLMHAIHATSNVDKTLAFYTQLFGVNGQVQAFTNPNVPILTNSPGVTLRLSMLRLPSDEPRGMGFELTEFSNVERHPAQPQISDPGCAAHEVLRARHRAGDGGDQGQQCADRHERSARPVKIQSAMGPATAIVVRDPDGYWSRLPR